MRFGVLSATGRCSSTYKVWANPTKDDVYLVPRAVARHIKVSLHESGQWHIRFEPCGVDHLPPAKRNPWFRQEEFAEGWTKAFTVVIPLTAAATPVSSRDAKVTWVVAPQHEALGVEFTVLLMAHGTPYTGWPGRTTMGTQLVGTFLLAGGATVWVVARALEVLPKPRAPGNKGLSFPPPPEGKQAFLERLRRDPPSSVKALFFGHDDDDHWWFMEAPLAAADDPRLPQ